MNRVFFCLLGFVWGFRGGVFCFFLLFLVWACLGFVACFLLTMNYSLPQFHWVNEEISTHASRCTPAFSRRDYCTPSVLRVSLVTTENVQLHVSLLKIVNVTESVGMSFMKG